MSQLAIAALALCACSLFMGGYALGWRDRGEIVARRAELAYGLLWRMGYDYQTREGVMLYRAQQTLLKLLDHDGDARGIEAAVANMREVDRAFDNPRGLLDETIEAIAKRDLEADVRRSQR